MTGTLLAAALCALVAAAALSRVLWSPRFAHLIIDRPNERSLHGRPTPRTGGIAVMAAVGASWLLFGHWALPALVALAGMLFALFVLEDIKGLPIRVRLGAQLTAAAAFLATSGPYAGLLWPLLLLGLVWSMNLYNFMDGSHGLAGGMASIGFAGYAVAAATFAGSDVAMLSAIIAAASAGFLIWNFDPARIFLGDAGSVPLGFLAGAVGLTGWQRELWPFWFPLLVFSPFAVDATLTLARRALEGERIWAPHKSHYYQRLIRMGWSHRRVALAAYGLMAAAGASALLLRDAAALVVLNFGLLWAAGYAILAMTIDRRWSAFSAAP